MTYLVSILIYLSILVIVGIYKAKSVKNSEDFMVAGRTLPWYVLVGTLLATWMGSGSLFSGAGLGYRNGLAGLWSSGGAWLGIALIYFISRRIRNFGKVTVPDIFEARYGKLPALLATITTVIAYTTIVSYQFRGGGKVLNMVTDGIVTLETGIIITALFAISYTVVAGMFSVVYTDVVNGILMSIGTLGALLFLVFKVGGVSEVIAVADTVGKWQLFGNWHMERVGDISGPIIAISFFVPTMLLLMGDANMYQRIFSARDGGSARKAVFFWIIGVVILESAISMLGLTGFVAVTKGIIPDIVANAYRQRPVSIMCMVSSAMPGRCAFHHII
jgi:SSS family solute:Na+ symporter/sodium/proline symporter